MENRHKIRVKIGQAEFEAEGSEEIVRAQYERFLAVLEADQVGQRRQAVSDNGTPSHPPTGEQVSPPGHLKNDMLNRLFTVDKRGIVSLRALPHTGENQDTDALIYLLYGFKELRDQDDVMVGQLIQAAKQSGIQADRIARAIKRRQDLVTAAGVKRGTKYGLNNRGLAYAEAGLMMLLS